MAFCFFKCPSLINSQALRGDLYYENIPLLFCKCSSKLMSEQILALCRVEKRDQAVSEKILYYQLGSTRQTFELLEKVDTMVDFSVNYANWLLDQNI